MKKFSKFLLIFVITIITTMAFFIGVKTLNNNSNVVANESEDIVTPSTPVSPFDYLSLTQENYAFTEADFVDIKLPAPSKDLPVLFVNKSVTLCNKATFDSQYDKFIVYVNSNQLTSGDYNINGKDYYVFDNSSLDGDKKTEIYIKVQLYDTKNHTYTTKVEYGFYIVQTNINFLNSNEFEWKYKSASTGVMENVSEPSSNFVYTPLTLSIPKGTQLNPIFIEFIYCGETFKIYNIDGIFYNANIADNKQLDFGSLLFNLSGTYTVMIYDGTRNTNSPSKNYLTYKFNIESEDLNGFYISVYDKTQRIIMNDQISNETTTVEFVNLKKIESQISKITVARSYTPSVGETIRETVEYTKPNLPNSLIFESDGSYEIKVLQTVEEIVSGIKVKKDKILKKFNFMLIQSIRTSFQIDGTVYEIGADEPSNTTKTIVITKQEQSNYNDITGTTSYDFNVTIARSDPQIIGVNNNARTSKKLSLTVYGVGNIKVSITQDGKTFTGTYKNGDSLPSFSDPGDYFIKITDEMGTTAIKSFKITVKMNSAAIILIAIAASVVFFGIILIVISRSRIKVR